MPWARGRPDRLKSMSHKVKWAIVVPASIGAGLLFTYLHIPAAWILAAILVSGTMALATGQELRVNQHFYGLARGFIGILAGVPLTLVPANTLLTFLPAALAMSFISLFVGLTGGLLLHRSQPREISPETAIMSMLPGGASLMPALADELGADYRYVALTQYLRLLTVSISLPFVTALLAAPHHASPLHNDAPVPWWIIPLTVAIAIGGEKLARLMRLPAAAIMGPLLLTVGVSALLPAGVALVPHELFRVMAFLSIGWVCGGGLSVPALKMFSRQLPATVAFIAIIIGVCAATAWPLTSWLDITYFEAYLATTPGALETVLALSAEGGAGPAVVAVQVTRIVIVLLVAGYLPQLLKAFRLRRD